jgi:plasmid stabilization system protein ParE
VKVFVTHTARTELAAITDWIGQDNPDRAKSFAVELLERALGLADFPSAFPLVEHFQHRGIRRRVHGQYLILYRVLADTVEVIHIVHGARDISALLAADDLEI